MALPFLSQSHLSATDILVVGAGPAGATTSLFLAKAQIPHTLIDRTQFPRGKVDGNVYGRKVVEILNRLDSRYCEELLARQDQVLGCGSAQIFAPGGGSFRLTFDRSLPVEDPNSAVAGTPPPFFTMNRIHFDAFLVSKLSPHYTDARWNTELTSLQVQPDGWVVSVTHPDGQDTLRPKLLIAADGANSAVVRLLGLKRKAPRHYDMLQGYFKGVSGFEGDRHIEGHFLPQVNPGFFFMAPLADGTVNVGINKPRHRLKQDKTDLQAVLQAAIAHHPSLAPRFAHSEQVSPLQPWPEVVGGFRPLPLSGNRYLLTGDAAGLCNPLTGFGTGSAMLSGQLAAQQAIQALQKEQFDRNSLKAYDAAVYQQLQTEFAASQALHQLTQQRWMFDQLTSGPWQRAIKGTMKTIFRPALETLKRM